MLVNYILDAVVGQSKPFEVVVAILIIVLSIISLVFLYRNVIKIFRANKKEKAALLMEQEDEHPSEKLFTKKEQADITDLRDRIDYNIRSSKESDLKILYSIDIDDFRTLVEKYDQKTIDKITLEIDKRLVKLADKQNIGGHLEKDKFVFFYTGEVTNEIISSKGEELLSLISEPLKVDNIVLTSSIGVCVFPYDGIDCDGLMKNAELAVYVAKKEGKARVNLYSEDLIEKERFNISYYQEIKNAIDNEEFLLYYQPIVDVNTGKLIGLESLLRWQHPEMGILPPGKFLNVMDLTGDITWFGMWGFERVVKKYSEWLKEFRIRQLFISINLSPKQLYIEDLAKKFYDVTTKYGMKADNFAFEVLDYFSVNHNQIAINNLHEFRKYGFRVAIDDSGDNFELADQMADISPNIYKIPRNDILKIMDEDPDTENILRVIKAAKDNHKIVIAEGIESTEMIRKMAELGLRFMQGFYFSEPVDVDKAKEMVKKSPWDMNTFDAYTK